LDSELHVFIIWKKARHKTEEILSDLKKKFELLQVYEVNWSSEFFSDNMSRFYGVNLPPGAFKADQHDFGPFLLCIIEDKNPTYDNRETAKGETYVNINIFDAKQTYRSWTGGGNHIHASNTTEEAEHDLVLLLGKNLKDVRNSLSEKWNSKIETINSDLVGSKGWKNTSQLFYVLNATVNYVILRNFENIPELDISALNSDIDILTNQVEEIRFITNGKKILEEKKQEFHLVKIENKDVLFHVGEQYYDPKWVNDILDRKILYQHEFYIPTDKDYFYSLLYRSLVQKPMVPEDHIEKLVNFSTKLKINNLTRENFSTDNVIIEILDAYMREMEYEYMPRGYSTFYNSEVVDFAIEKREYRMFLEKLETKNWLEVAAEVYQNKPWSYAMLTSQNRADFLFLLDIKKDDLALVIGADLGQIAVPLSRFCNVIAIENDPDKISIMKIIAKQENRNNIEFLNSEIYNTKFDTDKFDLVIINGFEKINSSENRDQMKNQQELLNESYRILKFDGTLYFDALNKFGLQYLLGENVDGLQDYVYLESDISKSIFETETGEKLKTLHHGKKEFEEMILKSGFKDVNFYGNLRDHRLPFAWVDLSTNKSSMFVANNLYFLDEFDTSNQTSSKYNEKLKHLYKIFSEHLPNLYSSYSMVAQK
jgi:SAM-dependent methyltransferase|tara:strand:- start:6590 stop:8548 length:1959 start_codon:yes stop_codon:yes gene_type:complete